MDATLFTLLLPVAPLTGAAGVALARAVRSDGYGRRPAPRRPAEPALDASTRGLPDRPYAALR
jgi:hypothetical protein